MTTAARRIGSALLLALALMACGSDDEDPAVADTSTTTTATTDTPAAEPAATSGADLTDELQAAAVDQSALIETATLVEEDRLEVATSIVDPRTDGSAEAAQALAICEAGVTLLEGTGAAEPKVTVFEADGTTFVVYGHPSYPGGCTEV